MAFIQGRGGDRQNATANGAPCNLSLADTGIIAGAVAVGRLGLPRVCSPSGSEGLRPPFHRTNSRLGPLEAKPGCARMGSDGRSLHRHRRVEGSAGCACASFRREALCGRPQRRRPGAQLVVRLQAIAPALIAVEATGGFETVVAASLASAAPAGRRRQSGAGPPLRAGARQARQDRSDRRRGHRPLRRGDAAQVRVLPDEATQLRRSRRPPAADRRDDGRRGPARAARRQTPAKSIARLRKALEKELAELDAEIDDQVRGSPVWAEGRPARLRPRRRIDHRPHADRRNAGTRNARPPSDRSARGASAVDATVRPVEGQELHRRRSLRKDRAQPAVCRRHGRRATQPGPQEIPATSWWRQENQNGSPSSPSPESC